MLSEIFILQLEAKLREAASDGTQNSRFVPVALPSVEKPASGHFLKQESLKQQPETTKDVARVLLRPVDGGHLRH